MAKYSKGWEINPTFTDDDDLFLLEELLQQEMYERSEANLYQFFINFWNTFDPQPLVPNWHLECLCEHIQAAMNREIRRLIINIPPRCEVGTENINLANGSYKPIKNIKIGDEVLSSDTKTINSNKVLDVIKAGYLDCLELKFSDGHTLKVSTDHKIYTVNRGWLKACELLLEDVVISPRTYFCANEELPLEDAFLLGLWVAEGFKGNRTHFGFANNTAEIINKAIAIAEGKGWRYRYDKEFTHRFINPEGETRGTGIKGSIRKWLEYYMPEEEYPTNCYDVRVPSCIFRATREAKVEFLNAFIACDGWIDTSSGKIATEVSSEQLAKDIYRLFKQLGYSPTLKNRDRKHTYTPQGKVTCAVHYTCTISKNSELQRAKKDFNFYHKQIKLESIASKDTSRLNDVPSCLIPLDKVSSNYRYRVKNTKWLQSTTLREYCLDEEWLDSLNLQEFQYLAITDIKSIGKQECFDLTVENDHTYFSEDILTHNSSKSTTSSITAPVWWWINNPYEKFWLVSHTAKLYMQNIVYARRILDHPLYKNRWLKPDSEFFKYELTKDQNTKTRIENSAGGYILGGSPTSGALGMGYTVAILDDILDSEESNNPQMVEAVNNWFTQTFLNRSNDVKNDVVIIPMQRLHENDITAYVQKTYAEQDWFVLNLPAKYEPQRTFISPIGYNDKRTVRNQLLDPIRLPDEFLITQSKNLIVYNTRYQQDPEAGGDGNLVKSEWLRESDAKPNNYSVMITVWDLSITETPEADYTVGLVICKFGDEYHIIDMWRKQCEIPAQIDAIKKMKKKYPKSIVGIEAKSNGHAAMSMLQRDIQNIYPFEPRKFGGNKEQRLGAILQYFRDKKVVIYNPFKPDPRVESTYDPEAIKKELKAFPLSAHDDIVDCVAYGVNYLAEYGQESTAVITKGSKITLFDEDYIDNPEIRNRINIYDYTDYDFDQHYIPTRNDLQEIAW